MFLVVLNWLVIILAMKRESCTVEGRTVKQLVHPMIDICEMGYGGRCLFV